MYLWILKLVQSNTKIAPRFVYHYCQFIHWFLTCLTNILWKCERNSNELLLFIKKQWNHELHAIRLLAPHNFFEIYFLSTAPNPNWRFQCLRHAFYFCIANRIPFAVEHFINKTFTFYKNSLVCKWIIMIITNKSDTSSVSFAFKDLQEFIVHFLKLLIFIVEYFAYFM